MVQPPNCEFCLFWRGQTVTWWHSWWIGRVVPYDAKVTGGRGNAIMHKLTDGILLCPHSGGHHVFTYSMLLIWNERINTRFSSFLFYLNAWRVEHQSLADKPLQTERSSGSVLLANQIAPKARFDLLQSAEMRDQPGKWTLSLWAFHRAACTRLSLNIHSLNKKVSVEQESLCNMSHLV